MTKIEILEFLNRFEDTDEIYFSVKSEPIDKEIVQVLLAKEVIEDLSDNTFTVIFECI